MSDKKWTVTFTDANGRRAEKIAVSEASFESIVHDKLNDLRTSDVSAVLPDGTRLDEAALRAKYLK